MKNLYKKIIITIVVIVNIILVSITANSVITAVKAQLEKGPPQNIEIARSKRKHRYGR